MNRTSSLTRSPMPARKTPMPAPRSPLPQGEWLSRSGGSKPRPAVAHPRSGSGRKDTIPPAVRTMVNHRDPWCMRCGSANHLHNHHRRLKGIGGDPRPHTDCACNLVRLCTTCHGEVHGKDRQAAEAEGFIVPAETLLPGSVGVLVRTADGGLVKYPPCGGRWLDEVAA